MAKAQRHKWEFQPRFRRHAFGWKSQPAMSRIKEAVSEIKKVARKDKALAAEGAVLFLEKVSPAIERVDSSSGAIGGAVNKAVEALASIIAGAEVDADTREAWLQRLWDAGTDDQIPYLERLGDHWGELCASKEVASSWADRLIEPSRLAWGADRKVGEFFMGTTYCLSALLAAERYSEILELLDMAPYDLWHDRQYGVKALAAQGRKAEALRYANAGDGLTDDPVAIAKACEEILLSSGLADEAYHRYGLVAARARTYLAWFRAVARKYPHKEPAQILRDLAELTPGEEGKWFAAAKSVGLFEEAITLANKSPGSPQTLTRAARDFAEKEPEFAVEAGMAALFWLVEGYGYEITSLHVLEAYSFTMEAAKNAGSAEETHRRIIDCVSAETFGERFVTKVLGGKLGLASRLP